MGGLCKERCEEGRRGGRLEEEDRRQRVVGPNDQELVGPLPCVGPSLMISDRWIQGARFGKSNGKIPT